MASVIAVAENQRRRRIRDITGVVDEGSHGHNRGAEEVARAVRLWDLLSLYGPQVRFMNQPVPETCRRPPRLRLYAAALPLLCFQGPDVERLPNLS
jgi:hypothetical protein